jgi:predicted ribosomally synthesized peptide with SipW-like signal peptide
MTTYTPRHAAPRPRRRLRSALRWTPLRALLSIGAVLGLGAVATFAYWSDTVTVTGASFSSGVLDLKLNGQDSLNVSGTFAITNLVPGESKAVHWSVDNQAPSTVPLAYTATGLASGDLAAHLTFRVFLGGTSSNPVVGGLRTGSCTGTATAAAQTMATTKNVIPTAQQLAASASQNVCVIAALPTSTPTNMQGKAATATFTFNATQLGGS